MNTVTAAVGANATAIGQTNAAVAQNTQAVSTLQQQQAAQQTANGNFATKTELATETQARKDGDNILKAKIDANTQGVAANKTTLGDHETRITQNEQDIDHLNTVVGGAVQHVNNLLTDNTKNKADIADLQSGKVDKADFTADQKRQDDALADSVAKQGLIDKTQDTAIQHADSKATLAQAVADQNTKDIATKASQADLDQSIKDQALTDRAQDKLTAQLHADVDGKVKTETADRKAADAAHDTALADHDSRITSNTNALTTKVDKQVFTDEQTKRDGQFVTLSSGVAAAQATGDYAHSRIDAANANIEANKQALVNTNKRVAQNTADIANHEQRITTLEGKTNAQFNSLKNQIDDNKRDANAGIAGVAAMANIPQVTQGARFSVGAGVGNRDGESAVAVGFSSRITDSVVGKASVAADTQSGFTVGAGVSYQW